MPNNELLYSIVRNTLEENIDTLANVMSDVTGAVVCYLFAREEASSDSELAELLNINDVALAEDARRALTHAHELLGALINAQAGLES